MSCQGSFDHADLVVEHCPQLASTRRLSDGKNRRASLGWTAEGGCPHMSISEAAVCSNFDGLP
jgi:hypothetical protein